MRLRVYYGIDPKGQGFYWPKSDQKRDEYFALKRVAPYDAEAIYGCNPTEFSGSIFTDKDFVYYQMPPFLEHGIHHPIVKSFLDSKNGMLIQSWDTAQEASLVADYSVCTTALLVPCSSYHNDEPIELFGPCDPHYDVYILDVFRDKLEFGAIFKEVKRLYRLWMPSLVLVEKKASGIGIIQGLRTAAQIPVEAMEANESKRSRATSNLGAGSVQGWFQSHRIWFPESAVWLEACKRELKNFTGLDTSPGADDFVDSLVHLVSYAIKKGSGTVLLPSNFNGEDSVESMFSQKREIIPPSLFSPQDDPFGAVCGKCRHYDNGFCRLHQKQFAALNSCFQYEGVGSFYLIQ